MMTPEEAMARLAEMDAAREAERQARRAAITPHVRKPNDRTKLSRHAATSPHNRVPIGAEITGTYCGAPITTEDWDRRSAVAKGNSVLVVESGVCTDCLDLARAEAPR